MDIITHQPTKTNLSSNLLDILLNDTPKKGIPCPSIKMRDQRCSIGCVKNWTMFDQKPPVYQICDCVYTIKNE